MIRSRKPRFPLHFLAALAAGGAAAAEEAAATVVAPDTGLAATYLACAAEAERRILPPDAAIACVAVYERLKLSFLPDVTPESYARLGARERSRVQRRAWAALTAWRAAGGAAEIADLR